MTARTSSFRSTLQTGAAVAVAFGGLLGGVAFAQDAAPAEDEVVVTGFRASLQSAIDAKRNSSNIVDVIRAEDIASFPDANLAESIQRIPGVSVERDAGEGRTLTVRGLTGDFVRTTLNGFESYAATTGSTLGNAVGGINRTRGFDFSTFASDLFSGITVSKSQSASMDEGSLAASIDLQTGRPFDTPGFHGAVSATAAYYDINESTSPRYAGLISNTWGDFGALVSFAYSTRLAIEDGYSDTSQSDYSDINNGFCGTAADIPSQPGSQVVNTAIPYVNPLSGAGNRPPAQCFSGIPSNTAAYTAINVPNVFLPRNPGLGRFTLDQQRIGVTTALQWRPSDATQVTLDLIYSSYDQDKKDYALSQASNNRNVNGASVAFPNFAGRVDSQIQAVNVLPNGQVDYMLIDNADIKHIQQVTPSTTESTLIGLDIEHDFSDRFRGHFRVGQTASLYDSPIDYFVTYDRFNTDGYSWDARASQRTPAINYGYDVTNPANVTFTSTGTGLQPDIRINRNAVYNQLQTAQADFAYDLNSSLTLNIGFMAKEYEFKSESSTRTSAAGTLSGFNTAQFLIDFPSLAPLSEVLTDWGGDLGLPAGSVTSWVVPDANAFAAALDLTCNCVNTYGDWRLGSLTTGARGNNYKIEESDRAVFAQLDFETETPSGMTLRGNVGIRYVTTDITSFGYTSATQSISIDNSYDNWLPSLNLALDVTPEFVTRFAYARVMARPALDALKTSGSITGNTGAGGALTASIGNPLLEPYGADNFNLSAEWYPEDGMVLSGTLFYSDIDTNIQSLTSFERFGDTGLSLDLLGPGQTADTIYSVSRARNNPGGWIQGLELNWQQDFTFLPAPFDGFGMLLNYTHIDSKVTYFLSTGVTATTAQDEYVGVSPDAINATLYYENEAFSARVSAAFREEYLRAFPFKAELPDAAGSYATTNIDASASYNLTDHLRISFDALNLTNQESDHWSGRTRRAQRVYSVTGRQFFLGAQYRF